ncbi:hypothetical protein [Saccharothrix stipae]
MVIAGRWRRGCASAPRCNTGGVDSYLADLDRALRWAERATDAAATPDDRATYRTLEIHYLLAKATLSTIAANVPAPLMSALVRGGVWSFTTALTYARAIADPLGRARALTALARLPAPTDVDRPLLLTQASVAAAAVGDTMDRAWAFAALIPCAPTDHRPALFDKAMAAADRLHRTAQAWLLSRLAHHVPDLVRERLLALARSERVDTIELSALSQALPPVPDLRDPLRTQVTGLRDPRRRLCLLIILANGASEQERAALLTEASALAATLDRSPNATEPGRLVSSLLRTGDSELGPTAVRALLAGLPDAERRPALDALLVALHAGKAAHAETTRLALPYLPDEARPPLVAQVLGDDPTLTNLQALAPWLPAPLLTRAVTMACAETTTAFRTHALTDLAPHLPADLLRHALGLVVELDTPTQRAYALVRLAPRLQENELLAVLRVIEAVVDPDDRALLLSNLTEHLPLAMLQQVFDALPDEANPVSWVAALIALAARLSGADRDRLTAAALDAARHVQLRQPELHGLLDDVTDPRSIWAVMALQSSLDSRRPGEDRMGLADVLHLVPRTAVDRAIPIARAMEGMCERSHALATLVLCAPESSRAALLLDALRAACADHFHLDGLNGLNGVFCRIDERLAAR